MDSGNNRALVVDSGLDADSIVAVDLTSGVRSVVSQTTSVTAINGFEHPSDAAFDSNNNVIYVVDTPPTGAGAVIAIQGDTGERVILSID